MIGEALNKFRKVEPTIEIEYDNQIVSFSNRLVHAYDSIDNSIILGDNYTTFKSIKAGSYEAIRLVPNCKQHYPKSSTILNSFFFKYYAPIFKSNPE